MFPAMLKNLLLIQSFGIQNRPFAHCNRDDDGSALAAILRHVRAYVAQPLNHYALALDSGGESQRPHFFPLGAGLPKCVEQPASGGLAPAPYAFLRYRLSGDTCRGVQAPGIERLVSVEDPCHLPLACAVIWRRHVNARPDEILFDQLVRV